MSGRIGVCPVLSFPVLSGLVLYASLYVLRTGTASASVSVRLSVSAMGD